VQEADRKLAWSAIAALTIVALELAWLLLAGPENRGGNGPPNHEPNYWEWIFSAAFWTAFFTGALTISTVFLWWTTRENLRHSQADSKRQSEETREQIELARQQFVATHRPRIAVRNIIVFKLAPDEPPEISVAIVNSGSSTATIGAIFAGIGVRTLSGIRPEIPMLLSPVGETPYKLASGEAMQFWPNRVAIPIAFSAGHVAAIRGLQARLFVGGEIQYWDDNGAMRSTGFIRWYDIQFNRFSALSPEWISSEMEYAD